MAQQKADGSRPIRLAMRGRTLGMVLAVALAVAPLAAIEASPAQADAPSACQATVSDGPVTYCLGYINAVTRTYYGVDKRVALDAVVDSVTGNRVAIHGSFWCPSGYCGASMASMTITFAAAAPRPAYGNMIRLYGRTVTGSLRPGSFVVNGQCDPYWGDC